ncbi:hypothetical protein [Arthrobacter sp. GMC3]|uniref:hypothetical protein n=1 Tax=Arthrobacter sp. GMC3 TaxID=2058894 RepID=UPI000CE319D5|nr:hypothetical protein [Arthrobacter sp. GMC3]
MSEQIIEGTETEEIEVEAPEVEAEATEALESEEAEGVFDADRARTKINKINSENRNLRKRATEAEEKAKDADGKGERVTALEAENLRLRVGVKHGLPEALIKRLSGTTEEEILQDAEELMALFGKKAPPTNQSREKLRGGGDPTVEPDGLDDPDKFAERMFRK